MKEAGKRIVAIVASATLAAALAPAVSFADVANDRAEGVRDVPFAPLSTQAAADGVTVGGTVGGSDPAYVEGEILVTFDGPGDVLGKVLSIASVAEADEASTLRTLDLASLASEENEPVVVKLDEGADEVQAAADARALPSVASAQLNYRYYLDDHLAPGSGPALVGQAGDGALTNDPALESYDADDDENAWHLQAIDIESAWEQVKCEGDVTVAVLDTGCDMLHEDLASNVLADYAWNAYKGEPLSCDYYGHGTHVAGCIAATANNAVGTAGSSYNAKILPINVFDAYGSDQWSSTTKALVTAYDYLFEFDERHPELNLHVVNMSLGGYGTASADDIALQNRIAKAKERDIVSVCAGGNGVNGLSQTVGHYPSDYDDSFAVTALSKDGYTPTTWCDRNSAKDICAPGDAIYSTVPAFCKMEGNANEYIYAPASGTSMATPVTAGVFALLWAARPDLDVDSAVKAVKETASDRLQFPSDDWYMDRMTSDYGAGILSAGNAVAYARKLPPNEKALSALSDAARDALVVLADVEVSVDGSDVPTTKSWVSKSAYDALEAAATAARDAGVEGVTYAEMASARDALESARAAFDDALAPGTMRLASASAKSALRHLARNAKADMAGIIASTDGKGLAVGSKWVRTAIANRLDSAIAAANALVANQVASESAVASATEELTSARSAFAAGVTAVAAKASASTKASASKSASSASSSASKPATAKKKAVSVNVATVNAKVVKKALKAANNTSATKITLGAKVKKISARAFKGTKIKTIVVKTKKLTKKSVKNSLAGSKVKTVKVSVGKAKANKTYVKKYKKLFVKKVAGKKATVKC